MSQGFTSQLPIPLPVAQGGTGVTSTTAYAVVCGGTTSTGNLQSIAGVGTSGQVLTSNGAGALPTFQANAASTGAAKAWVNFNGTGAVAINTSFNVTSITDNNTGDYTVNFTTAFSSADYSVSGACADTTASRILLPYGSNVAGNWTYAAPTTTALRIGVTSFTGFYADASIVNVACFGNQ
jgi:hypothetical protein